MKALITAAQAGDKAALLQLCADFKLLLKSFMGTVTDFDSHGTSCLDEETMLSFSILSVCDVGKHSSRISYDENRGHQCFAR